MKPVKRYRLRDVTDNKNSLAGEIYHYTPKIFTTIKRVIQKKLTK